MSYDRCKYQHALRANIFGRACFFPYGAWSGPVRTTSALSRLQKMLLGANRVYLINFKSYRTFFRCYSDLFHCKHVYLFMKVLTLLTKVFNGIYIL